MAKLRVHNIESGPASSDVAFGISGDTVAVSSDSLKLNTWKDSGGNTLFQSDGAGTLSNVNSTFSGAGPKLILSQTASNSASISFTSDIDSTYDKYMFVITDFNPVTNSAETLFQCSTDGGSNYNTTLTSTYFLAYHNESDTEATLSYSTGSDQAQGTSFQVLQNNVGSGADESCAGILYLFSPSSTTYVKQWYSRFNTMHAGPYSMDVFVAGYFNTTSAINAIQFKANNGNFDGKIKMYGIS